ncbi:FxSxx-COOH system tetratricopeptide repeat protein [Streptomyces sp. NBC_00162]|uniref:FxSxx-COOH system tetratricopeptide repeat protein n=1 Tax=Streptomyces sp. NBC_00162 TaxID=2903629 RepID=UPI00214C623D|nr:FxSxx-COOH system tetratricopeptide repeat protein [Streptomyces sp. NBC_00162]UUU45176.1 FxSxx-COOH system tetratricopeptide repeat protein [Streptomyces sp. NBC_00162]
MSATQGAIAARGDINNSVAVYAERALPAEAYAPIPADAAAQGVSNIPAAAGFVGRGTALDALDAAFADGAGGVVLHAVHGLGGVGKSALAAHWAAYRATARVRWWITADSPDAVDAGLASLARALEPGLGELPAELQIERAVQWLATHVDWLVVLDNVDRIDDVGAVVDRVAGRGRGRVLVTTRRATGWYRHAATVRLDVFEPDESVTLFARLLTHHGPRDADGADTLCAELGHLALAVEQAAAYCAETGTSPRAYLDMLAQWPAAMFAAAAEGSDSERTIARIWRLTLDRLTDTPLAGDLLRILAWYAPDGIPRDLLDGTAEPPELTAAIGRLIAYSMVTDNHDGTLTVHRLVQALARTPDPDDPHRRPEDVDHARNQAAARLADAFPIDVDQPATWPRCRALLPHTDALTRNHTPDLDTDDTAHALDRAATYQQGQGALSLAVKAFQRALATRERVLGPDHPRTLVSRSNLAGAYWSAGDLVRAVPLFERTLEDSERVLGADHPDTLISGNNLAHAYESAGDLVRAVPLYERTLEDRVRVLGADHPGTLLSRDNLAGAYESAGDLVRALPLYERTLRDRVRVLGPDHPRTLASRNNLAYAYESAGDLVRAVPLYERTLEDSERVLGADHPDTLITRNNLAYAYESAGDLVRAVPLYERTLEDRVRVLGADHPDTLVSRSNLAGAYWSAGDLVRAVPLYERTLEDRVRVLGADHPDTLVSRNNLAGAYWSAGDLVRAVPLYERTLEDCERVLSPGHPTTALVRSNLELARST